jgi:hypothetical protein
MTIPHLDFLPWYVDHVVEGSYLYSISHYG